MKINNLYKLAELFSPYATLYAVGGYVRDKLLGLDCSDIDICSKLDVKVVKKILLNTEFVVLDRNLRMGTIHILCEGNCFEYTTFRLDSYDKKTGNHYPEDVEFTDDISLDAKRRDFKCNAIYYDILKDSICDPNNYIGDVNERIISTTDDPNIVFEADGLRILRMVRFSAELGFAIEEYTYSIAKKNAWRVKDISVERIRDELDKIFIADQKHKELNLKDAHLNGVKLLDDLGLLELLLPEVFALKGLEQPKKYHLYDGYNHTLKVFEVSPPNLRWVSLLHDIGKVKALKENGNGHMNGHDIIGEEMARDILYRLKFSNEERDLILNVIRWHMVDLRGDMSEYKLRRFIVEHSKYIDLIAKFKVLDCIGTCGRDEGHRIERLVETMKNEKIPFNVKDLCINGKDLITLEVPEHERSTIMHELLLETAMNPKLNNRDSAINFIKNKK